MLTCKLCGSTMDHKHIRRDGSMLCPECGQIYWKAAVDKVVEEERAAHRQSRLPDAAPRLDARRFRLPGLRSA